MTKAAQANRSGLNCFPCTKLGLAYVVEGIGVGCSLADTEALC